MSVINSAYLGSLLHLDVASVDPTILLDVIATAQAACEQYCRVDGFENDATVDEYHDIDDTSTREVLCRVLPVNSITALSNDAHATTPTTVSSDDYILDGASGRIALASSVFAKGVQAVRVQYDGGYTAALMPAAIRLAVAHEAARIWNNTDRAGVASESVDGASIEWERGRICLAAAEQLEPYRRRVL